MYTSEPEETSAWQVLAVGGTLTETLVTNLQAPLTYYFKVQARNAMGYGPFSDVVVYTVQQGNSSLYSIRLFCLKNSVV